MVYDDEGLKTELKTNFTRWFRMLYGQCGIFRVTCGYFCV